jgi:hypothetical protein
VSQPDLRQADLSRLTLKQMNTDQRAEMKRRLESFMQAFAGRSASTTPEPPKKVKKWTPGMKS